MYIFEGTHISTYDVFGSECSNRPTPSEPIDTFDKVLTAPEYPSTVTTVVVIFINFYFNYSFNVLNSYFQM